MILGVRAPGMDVVNVFVGVKQKMKILKNMLFHELATRAEKYDIHQKRVQS